jgi:hypothetical protein
LLRVAEDLAQQPGASVVVVLFSGPVAQARPRLLFAGLAALFDAVEELLTKIHAASLLYAILSSARE